MSGLTRGALAALIDHTVLKPETTRADIEKLCHEALHYRFACVCVPPFRVAQAHEILRNSPVRVATVIGFPHGAHRSEIKALEAVRACADGALELDMVMNVGAVKDGNWAVVQTEIEAVVRAAQERIVKVILEICLLSDAEIVRACRVAKEAGALYVKTSTGFAASGAAVERVRLMRETVGSDMGVKASGGIRDRATLEQMVAAGANRIGTSYGVAIIEASSTQAPAGDY